MERNHRDSFDLRCFVVAVAVVHENCFDQMNADVVVVVVEASYLKLLLMPPRLRINQLNFRKKIDLN